MKYVKMLQLRRKLIFRRIRLSVKAKSKDGKSGGIVLKCSKQKKVSVLNPFSKY